MANTMKVFDVRPSGVLLEVELFVCSTVFNTSLASDVEIDSFVNELKRDLDFIAKAAKVLLHKERAKPLSLK